MQWKNPGRTAPKKILKWHKYMDDNNKPHARYDGWQVQLEWKAHKRSRTVFRAHCSKDIGTKFGQPKPISIVATVKPIGQTQNSADCGPQLATHQTLKTSLPHSISWPLLRLLSNSTLGLRYIHNTRCIPALVAQRQGPRVALDNIQHNNF